MFSEAEIISRYTRRQAIEDGVLVQLSGPGYQGDAWIPEMLKEAGFRYRMAMTSTVFTHCVTPVVGEGERLASCQDVKGRLWDVLWMLKAAIRKAGATDTLWFSLRVVPNVSADCELDNAPRARLVKLKCVCGPDDDGSPCLTIMYPEED